MLCGQRFYDPSVGRWLNRDPIGSGGGLNLYRYCMGNPVMEADPAGTQVISVSLGVLGGCAVGGGASVTLSIDLQNGDCGGTIEGDDGVFYGLGGSAGIGG